MRHLFRLANRYCEQQLENEALSVEEEATLTMEWARTLSAEALHTPSEQRTEIWRQAHVLLDDFSTAHADHPQQILIQLQKSLITLSQGELVSQEYELGLSGEGSLEIARQLLRDSINQLKSVEDAIALLIRQPSPTEGALSPHALQSISRNTSFHMARAYQLQGMTYPAEGNNPDRILALSLALERLEPLAQRSYRDALFWKSRINEIIGSRLLSRYDIAAARLDALEVLNPPTEINIALQAERIRLHLATDREEEAVALLRNLSDDSFNGSADWKIAMLEVCLAMATKAASDAQEQALAEWQQHAVLIVDGFDQRHGLYWRRRAEAMLAQSAQAGTGSGNIDILEWAAIENVRRGAWEEALAAYDGAAEKAWELEEADRAFDLLFTAAVIEHRQQKYDEAIERFSTLARKIPDNPRAAEAHLLAAFDASQLISNEDPSTQEPYIELLHEHLALWPESMTASKAAWWLGRIQEAQGHWLQAMEAYALVQIASENSPLAATGYGRCSKHYIDSLPDNERGAACRRALEHLQKFYLDPQGQIQSPWTAASRSAVHEAASLFLFLREDYAAAEHLLSTALADAAEAPPEWIASARVLLVVAYAGGHKNEEAERLLNTLTNSETSQWILLLRGLSAVMEEAPDSVQHDLAQLQIQTIEQLEPQRAAFPETLQATLDRTEAEAHASMGQHAKALELYAQAASKYENDPALQEGYARILSASVYDAELEQALDQWRIVIFRAEPQSSLWFRGKYELASVHFRLGHREQASQMIHLLQTLHPDMGGPQQKAKFLHLLSEYEE